MIRVIPEGDWEEQIVLQAHLSGELREVLCMAPYKIESAGLAEPVYGGGDEQSLV